jgi:hypothetical protein
MPKEHNPHSKSPVLAVLLSVLPGLSLVYIGLPKKAIGLFVIDAGIILTIIFSDSYVLKCLMAGIYLVTFGPACLESYQIAKYGQNTIDTEARWYVTILLLTTGFSALPLLWKSGYFSKEAKIGWSIAVPVLAVFFFTVLANFWTELDHYLRTLLT